MTYVVTENCIRCKYTDCVVVCPVECFYELLGPDRFRFRASRVEEGASLVIDPQLLYSTYLGGSSTDAAYALALDSTGAAVVAGFTMSTNFPTQNAFQTSTGGSTDASGSATGATGADASAAGAYGSDAAAQSDTMMAGERG